MKYSRGMMIDEINWYGLEGICETQLENVVSNIWKGHSVYTLLPKNWLKNCKKSYYWWQNK